MKKYFLALKAWAAWAPGIEDSQALKAWGEGKKHIKQTTEAPALKFLPALFRRRLSQLSRMVLQIGHDLAPPQTQIPCVFASHYGEINKQYKISKQLIDSFEVSPAAFSLSVFNAPVFLLSIAQGNKEVGSAVYSGDQALSTGLLEMLGMLASGNKHDCMLIFADEYIHPTYHSLFESVPEPYAFGMVFSKNSSRASQPYSVEINMSTKQTAPQHPLALLRWLLTPKESPFILHAPGMELIVRYNPDDFSL